MAILDCFAEDIDFVDSGAITTGTGFIRAGYSRCCIHSSDGGYRKSTVFPGGYVTSCWFSFQAGYNNNGTGNNLWAGLVDNATAASGLWIGIGATAGTIALFKFDGTTKTILASNATVFYPGNSNIQGRFDVQLVSYGATATVNVYFNAALIITFTGNVTVSGVTQLNCVGLNGFSGNSRGFSEFIVATDDTRTRAGLLTGALTGAGTTDAWTGLFSNINGTSFSDANPINSNVAAQDEQFNITDAPAILYSVDAVKIAARMAVSSTPTATQIKLGYNSAGTVAFGTGSTKTPGAVYSTQAQLDLINPVTGVAFTSSEINALQLDLRSA
jgi:hypothetical protein